MRELCERWNLDFDTFHPAAMWGEKKGCVTNADRSVNLLLKAVEPPGEARTDFDIVVEIARRLGFKDKDGAPLIPFAEVFAPFHYGRGSQAANQHTWYARDPVSLQPHLKSSPVAVRRLSFGQPEPWLLARLEELNGTSIVPFAARELDGTVNHTVPRQTRSEALPMQGGDGSP